MMNDEFSVLGVKLAGRDQVKNNRRVKLGDIGINSSLFVSPGHRDPVVPVTDKVDLADLYKRDRRQRDLVVVGFVNLDPAIFSMGLAGQESPIEFLVTPGAAYDEVWCA